MNRKQIVIAGGSGFIGRALAAELIAHHFNVIILTRTPNIKPGGVLEIVWDGKTPGAWVKALDGARAVINLTGKNINCPHTPENLRLLKQSRTDSVRAIAAGIAQVAQPPRVWVQAGAAGFYGDAGDRICDENAPGGTGALAGICREWEDAFAAAAAPQTRKVLFRIGVVLGRDGGAFPVLRRLAKCFLGGRAGNGRQYISWIHQHDLVKMFVVAIGREHLKGVFNAAAPAPVTNALFMEQLRRAVRRPWGPPAPEFAVRLGARLMETDPSLILSGQCLLPAKFLEMEFQWRFPELRLALADLCGRPAFGPKPAA